MSLGDYVKKKFQERKEYKEREAVVRTAEVEAYRQQRIKEAPKIGIARAKAEARERIKATKHKPSPSYSGGTPLQQSASSMGSIFPQQSHYDVTGGIFNRAVPKGVKQYKQPAWDVTGGVFGKNNGLFGGGQSSPRKRHHVKHKRRR